MQVEHDHVEVLLPGRLATGSEIPHPDDLQVRPPRGDARLEHPGLGRDVFDQ